MIEITGARENNLKNIDVAIPQHQLTVITGKSGSGKSSLAFNVIAKEGKARYLNSRPGFAAKFAGKITRPDVDRIDGLSPVITLSQLTTNVQSKSTLGTLSDAYDYLRLLYARLSDTGLTKSDFSFNTSGACPHCQGLGMEERISIDKLIADENLTLREGALAPSLPTGYIMYSQVTIDVLNDVCQAHDFNVDIKWCDLSSADQEVILYGSTRIKVPFGKHSLESRLKWTGIKAKPREDGFYRGMVPIMSEILKRDRNKNILKYVDSVTCSACDGKKLNAQAMAVELHRKNIAQLSDMPLESLLSWCNSQSWSAAGASIIDRLTKKLEPLIALGFGEQCLSQSATSLSIGEVQRIKMINQFCSDLCEVTYVLDEPAIGLHPGQKPALFKMIRNLVNTGNTVIMVEHDLDLIAQSDWIVEVGPGAGSEGGEIVYSGKTADFFSAEIDSPTRTAFQEKITHASPATSSITIDNIQVSDELNVIEGSTLHTQQIAQRLAEGLKASGEIVHEVNQKPIGRTPRSNAATYIGLSDHFRDLYAKQPKAKEQKLSKSAFSFNNKGGRCEKCEGAGQMLIGMHFMENIGIPCPECNGKRFNETVLSVRYGGLTLAEVYQLPVSQAMEHFANEPKITHALTLLNDVGLHYLPLGQASTTLSGGEAQRIKLAKELSLKSPRTILLDQPTTGLHHQDIKALIQVFYRFADLGIRVICMENNVQMMQAANLLINAKKDSVTYNEIPSKTLATEPIVEHVSQPIVMNGITTNNLKSVNLNIPNKGLTAIVGLSGSGKSSLIIDSLFAESNTRFNASLSTHARSYIHDANQAKFVSASGLRPATAISQRQFQPNDRSTVGTITGIYDAVRLLYARLAPRSLGLSAQHFSFNTEHGACLDCGGKGYQLKCSHELLVVDEDLSILEGALSVNKHLKYYSDLRGQFMSTLNEAAANSKIDLWKPWSELNDKAKDLILFGTGDKLWSSEWSFKTKTKEGVQSIEKPWLGLVNYIDDEYERTRHNKKLDILKELLTPHVCSACEGSRLRSHYNVKFEGYLISELVNLSLDKLTKVLLNSNNEIAQYLFRNITPLFNHLSHLGLGYLSLSRESTSLSGGEAQRLLLIKSFGDKQSNMLYIFDEPTAGLHDSNTEKLIEVLTEIAVDNAVVIIEHDLNAVKACDHLIELGPGAGKNGGSIINEGPMSTTLPKSNLQLEASISKISPLGEALYAAPITIEGAHHNNLKNITVAIPIGGLTVISGVSGAGKSSLLSGVLYPSLHKNEPVGCKSITANSRPVFYLSQKRLTGSTTSSLATRSGIIELFRKKLLPLGKSTGLKKGHFSYLTKEGRCESCLGKGLTSTALDFISDIKNTCETCHGNRHNESASEVKLNDWNIGDIMTKTMDELFGIDPKIDQRMAIFRSLGLGHIPLKRATSELSGGERQRLALALVLTDTSAPSLFLLEEPTVGLHTKDTHQFIENIRTLSAEGHTFIVVEHQEQMISAAHKVITLGPKSGDLGGQLV